MNRIDEAAADWVARTDGATLSSEEQDRLEAWLAADVRHRGAYLRAQALLVAYEDAQLPNTRPFQASSARTPMTPSRRALIWGSGAAAGLGIASFGLWMGTAGTAFATARGETRSVALADGGELLLNTETRVRVGRSRQSLRLEQGEVWVRNSGQPLIVRCGDVQLEAGACAFSLRRTLSSAMLTVEAGRVKIGSGQGAQTVAEGEQAVLSDERLVSIRQLDQVQRDQARAWRDGMIAFEDATLAEAAAEFARYNTMAIVLGDRAAQNRRVSGLFNARDPEGFARAVSVTSGLRVRRGEGRIILSSAPQPAS